MNLDCKTVGFFSKSVKKSVKRGVSLVPDLLFDCSRVLEYAKIRTVLQSRMNFPYKAVLQAARGEHAKGRGGLLFSLRAFSSPVSSFA